MERPIGSEFEVEIRLRLEVTEGRSSPCGGCFFEGLNHCPWDVLGRCGNERDDHKSVIFREVISETKLIKR